MNIFSPVTYLKLPLQISLLCTILQYVQHGVWSQHFEIQFHRVWNHNFKCFPFINIKVTFESIIYPILKHY